MLGIKFCLYSFKFKINHFQGRSETLILSQSLQGPIVLFLIKRNWKREKLSFIIVSFQDVWLIRRMCYSSGRLSNKEGFGILWYLSGHNRRSEDHSISRSPRNYLKYSYEKHFKNLAQKIYLVSSIFS